MTVITTEFCNDSFRNTLDHVRKTSTGGSQQRIQKATVHTGRTPLTFPLMQNMYTQTPTQPPTQILETDVWDPLSNRSPAITPQTT